MRGIIIYDSSYGNTRTIAETIAQTLGEYGIETDTLYVKDVKKLNAGNYDFLALGSPTKCGTMSFTVKNFIGRLKEKDWMNKPFIAFDTENPENIEQSKVQNKNWSAAEKIAIRLEDKKMVRLLPVHKALVLGWKGPLPEGQIERTKAYTGELIARLKATRVPVLNEAGAV